MDDLRKKWGLLAKALAVVAVLIAARVLIHLAGWAVIPVNTLITAFIGAVIFTIAILFTGTLADYKESEKIPGDLATAILSLHMDAGVVPLPGDPVIPAMRAHVRDLLGVITRNLRANTWDVPAVRVALLQVNADVAVIAGKNVAPPLFVKMRNELTAIDRISNRVHTIASTSFIPTAYAIAELATAAVVILLLFLQIDSFPASLVLIAGITGMLLGLLFLIRDMDNPFEVGQGTYADVDLQVLWDLETYLASGG